MIKQDYKWPSTIRNRRKARDQKIAELGLFGASVNLICVGLFYLIPNGSWLFLMCLILGVSLMTAQLTRLWNK
jgi:hypothetical protein